MTKYIEIDGIGEVVPRSEYDELAAQVEAFGVLIHEGINGEGAEPIATDGQITGYAISYEWLEKVGAAIDLQKQHLLELRADTAEKFYYMGWEHSLSTKSDGGDHYGCGKRLAKSFADSVRRGEVKL